jgi:hypothetical protein
MVVSEMLGDNMMFLLEHFCEYNVDILDREYVEKSNWALGNPPQSSLGNNSAATTFKIYKRKSIF